MQNSKFKNPIPMKGETYC